MNAKKMMAAFCAAGLVCATFAQEAKQAEVEEKDDGLSYTPGEGISFGEQKILAAEAGLAFDSKYITYGVVDGKDPILTPSAKLTLLDWLYFEASAIYDVTKGNGKRGGYGKRTGKRTTFDATVGVAHDFDLGDTLGALSIDFNYIYEYCRRYYNWEDEKKEMGDTQYLNLEISLGDLWFEPTLAIERDIMADNGTYVNFEVGHKFVLIGENKDDATLTFRPSVGQGFGNNVRVRSYDFYTKNDEPLNHGGLMDTNVKGEFEWAICDCVSLSAYVAYYDYIFDSNMRGGARSHNAAWGNASHYRYSWNVVGGVALTFTF